MIEILRDNNGAIKGVVEYYIVNSDGSMNDNGIYCWINDCEVAPQYRNNGCLKNFVKIVINRYPQLQFGYFKRLKYGGRIKMYSKKLWLKLIGGEDGANK